jgi:DNA-directed RNA polymerase subunit M/transcription elongation factor TFIIS
VYLCPECGSFLSPGASECSNCGVVFEEEEELGEVGEEIEEIVPIPEEEILEVEEEEIKALYICPSCGAF